VSDYRRELAQHAARVLAPGERLLASVRAMPVGPFGGSMGIFAGAVVGAIIQSIAISRSVKRARLSGFPIAGRMAVGITDRRILVWQRGGPLGGSIKRFIGDVPITRISRIDVEPVPGRSKLAFVFRDAQAVTVEADKRDSPDRFAEAFHRHVGVGGVSSIAVPMPPQVLVPAAPVAAAVPAAASPAAPAAIATGLAEKDGKKCPTCETHNHSSADFCWRCFALFAQPSHPFMARPGPGGEIAGAKAFEAPPAPAGSWTSPQAPPSWLPAPSAQQPAERPVAAKIGAAAFVALLVAGAAIIAVGRTHHSRISIPDSIAGAERLVTPDAQEAEQQIIEGARRYGITGKAGFYGTGGLPSFAVIAFDYRPGPLDTPDALMQGLASGVAESGTGSSVDFGSMTTDSVGEITYRCVQVLGRARMAICLWQESDVLGAVAAINQGIPEARMLTDTVRVAVES
jgi:hypothetical protein